MPEFQISVQLHFRSIDLSDAGEILGAIQRDRGYLQKRLPFVNGTREAGDSDYFINFDRNQIN